MGGDMELIVLRELRDRLLAENEALRGVERAARRGKVIWDHLLAEEGPGILDSWEDDCREALAKLDALRRGAAR